MSFRIILFYCLIARLTACNPGTGKQGAEALHTKDAPLALSDQKATPMAIALFSKLHNLSANHVLLGHGYPCLWHGLEG